VDKGTSLYRILQVDPAAEDVVIHAAYRALMKRHHPDAGGTPTVAERLNAAYATLRDPAKRAHYDRSLSGRRTASLGVPSETSRAPLARELGPTFPRRFEPVSAPGFAWMFDFVGAVTGAPRARIWVARFHRGDPVDAKTFRARIDAARLSRPLWSLTSSLFVAVLEKASPFFTAMVRAPRGPLTAWTHAVTVLTLSTRTLEAAPGTNRLRAFRDLAAAVAATG
jgi:DnaJ domain